MMKWIHVLLVEDNEGDVLLIKEAFEETESLKKISVVRDGEEARDFLFKRGKYSDVEAPDLILLDVNLPKFNGHEVLRFIKSTDHLRHIPVIMLSTSFSKKDVMKAYRSYVNCYIAKPVDADGLLGAMVSIESFWVNLAQLPGKHEINE